MVKWADYRAGSEEGRPCELQGWRRLLPWGSWFQAYIELPVRPAILAFHARISFHESLEALIWCMCVVHMAPCFGNVA